jgi:hypothetical protein
MGREVNNAIGAGTNDHDTERQYLFSSSNIRICRNGFVSRVEHCYGEFALYRWKLAQKLVNALPAFKVIEKGADGNTGTDKHQTTAEDIRVSVRDIGKRDHVRSPFGSAPMLPQTLKFRKRASRVVSHYMS